MPLEKKSKKNKDQILLSVMAAGSSSRFGGCKLAAEVSGKPLLAHTMDACGPFRHKVLVTGDHRQKVQSIVASRADKESWIVLTNPEYKIGLASSIACAANYAETHGFGALMIVLADQIGLKFVHMEGLKNFFLESQKRPVITRYPNCKGPPTIFPASCFAQLSRNKSGQGARHLLAGAREWLSPIDFRDVDKRADIQE